MKQKGRESLVCGAHSGLVIKAGGGRDRTNLCQGLLDQ
jgi:hypothetical protein